MPAQRATNAPFLSVICRLRYDVAMRSKLSWLIVVLAALSSQAGFADALSDKVWIHGSERCEENRDPPLDVFRFDADTYLLRQNKCVNFEGPFIYVLFGEHTVF